MSTQSRLARFAIVGAIGIGVQLLVLGALNAVGVQYLVATAIAVESAIVHNYVWHQRYTWADRAVACHDSLARIMRFQVSAGLVSMVGNIALMVVFRGWFRLPLLIANLASISLCALLNFALSDRWVFVNAASETNA